MNTAFSSYQQRADGSFAAEVMHTVGYERQRTMDTQEAGKTGRERPEGVGGGRGGSLAQEIHRGKQWRFEARWRRRSRREALMGR
jgi:hypothetical protein